MLAKAVAEAGLALARKVPEAPAAEVRSRAQAHAHRRAGWLVRRVVGKLLLLLRRFICRLVRVSPPLPPPRCGAPLSLIITTLSKLPSKQAAGDHVTSFSLCGFATCVRCCQLPASRLGWSAGLLAVPRLACMLVSWLVAVLFDSCLVWAIGPAQEAHAAGAAAAEPVLQVVEEVPVLQVAEEVPGQAPGRSATWLVCLRR